MDRIVAFYRSDSSRAMKRALVGGASLVTMGALVMVLSFLTRQPPDVRMIAACIGVAFIVAGTVTAVVGLQRLLANEACIVVRQDGIVVQGRDERFVAWDDVEAIRFAPGMLLIVRRDGSEITVGDRRFGGKDARALATELDGMRRKAAFALLGR